MRTWAFEAVVARREFDLPETQWGDMSGRPESVPRHLPVLADELLQALAPQAGETWVDCTVGAGGHSLRIAERIGPTGRLIALDQDPAMLELARNRLKGLPVTLVHASFDQLGVVLDAHGILAVDGLIADLGICSDQLDDARRGLSFRTDGPLDMRLDPTRGRTAAALLAELSERELADILFRYGEERYSRRIARQIVETRRHTPIRTTGQLADLVRQSIPWERRSQQGRFDPATRTFQALRIAVNDEIAALESLLQQLPQRIRPGGRVGIISFHSLEDRRVKQAFRDRSVWQLLTKKPIEPSAEEQQRNPRSRSAKLRLARRFPPASAASA